MANASQNAANLKHRRITVYREDSTTPVVYEPVQHVWYEAGNTVLVIAFITDKATGAHDYVHWPMSRVMWFKDEKLARHGRGAPADAQEAR